MLSEQGESKHSPNATLFITTLKSRNDRRCYFGAAYMVRVALGRCCDGPNPLRTRSSRGSSELSTTGAMARNHTRGFLGLRRFERHATDGEGAYPVGLPGVRSMCVLPDPVCIGAAFAPRLLSAWTVRPFSSGPARQVGLRCGGWPCGKGSLSAMTLYQLLETTGGTDHGTRCEAAIRPADRQGAIPKALPERFR